MRKYIILTLIAFIFPLTAYADSINLDCPSEIETESEFTCTVSADASIKVTGVKAAVSFDSAFDFVAFIPSSGFFGDGDSKLISLMIDPEVTGHFNLGTFKFKNNGSAGTVRLNDIIFYDTSVSSHSIESVSQTIKIKSNQNSNSTNDDKSVNNKKDDATVSPSTKEEVKDTKDLNDDVITSTYLIDLKIDNYDLAFYKEVFEYTLKIEDEKKLVIEPTLEDLSSEYEIIGNDNLKDGSIIYVKVKSKNDETNTYKINIVKDSNNKGTNYKTIFLIVIAVLVVLNICRLLFKRRGNNE